ncbi:MAG: type II toxin-antitoxin system VapC family toxin [Candidatus Acidiferrales bacterium]
MTLLILDASVAAKWYLPARDEPLADEAFQLLRRYEEGEVRFAVPDLFWAESANLLWKAVSRGRCTKQFAETALRELQERALPTVSSLPLLNLAFAIASAFQRSVYDSLYIALAVHSKAQFITADERLANAVVAQLPVKWLGALAS